LAKAYNGVNFDNLIAMAQPDTIDQIAERVDHLLLRHEELQRTHLLLNQQVQALTQERDQLKSRLSAARARVDSLIERLPQATPAANPEASE
jgi:cell division protein ZapB